MSGRRQGVKEDNKGRGIRPRKEKGERKDDHRKSLKKE